MKWNNRHPLGFVRNIAFITALVVYPVRGSQQNPARGTIQGTVTRLGTTESIADVQITVANPNASAAPTNTGGAAQPLLSAVSDSGGRFLLSDVPVGNLVVRAQLQGYFGPSVNGTHPSVSTVTATVTAGKTTEVQLFMIPGGSLSGRVLDPNGRALPDAPVQALRSSYQNGLVLLVAAGRTTDDRGDYRLYRLQPGQYYLSVTPQPAIPVGSRSSSASGPREIPIRTLYPSTVDLSTAVPVEVRSGEETSGLDIRIKTARGFTVSGMVTSALPPGPVIRCRTTSVGAAGTVRPSIAEIMLVPVDREGFGDAVAFVMGKEDGSFEINNVFPGSYDLIARLPVNLGWGEQSPPGFSVGALAFGRSRVTVRGDENNMNVVVHSGVDLKGIVTVDGKPTPAEVRIALEADDVATRSGVYSGVIGQVATYQSAIGADGSFMIPLVPEAHYRLNVTLGQAPQPLNPSPPCPPQTTRATQSGLTQLPQDVYVADIRQGGASVYDDGLSIGSSSASPVEIVLKTNAGSLEGTVVGADQKPAVGALVVIVPPTNRRQNPALYRTVRSDTQGRFSLIKLLPGPYKVFALESVQPGAYQNATFLQKIEERGTAVNISPGARADITVGLIQGDVR